MEELLRAVDRTAKVPRCNPYFGAWAMPICLFQQEVPELDLFQLMDRDREVDVCRWDSSLERVEDYIAFMQTNEKLLRCALLSFDVAESGVAFDMKNDSEVCVVLGKRGASAVVGIRVGTPSPGCRDKEYRLDLFRRCLLAAGLDNRVQTNLIDGRLRMFPAAGEELLEIWFPSAEPDGSNPMGFEARGLESLEDSARCAQAILRLIARSVVELRFFAKIPDHAYESVRPKLNRLAPGWSFDIFGRLAKPVAELVADAEREGEFPARIPAFEWTMGTQDTTVQAEIVLVGGGGYLELTTTYPHLNKVIAAGKKYTGLDFVVAGSEPEAREPSG